MCGLVAAIFQQKLVCGVIGSAMEGVSQITGCPPLMYAAIEASTYSVTRMLMSARNRPTPKLPAIETFKDAGSLFTPAKRQENLCYVEKGIRLT